MAKQKWKYSVGKKPHTVTVYEREPGGILQARAWNPAKEGWQRVSLGHRDRKEAEGYAIRQAGRLMEGKGEITTGKVTLARVFALYEQLRTPRKTEREQKADARRIELWARFLGGKKDPYLISLRDWEAFTDARLLGAIDARGRITEGEPRPVRKRAVEADLLWLRWVFNWAVKWRTPDGAFLMRENPVRGYERPTEKNVRRPVATQDRYEKVRVHTDQISMEIRWNGKREERRSYLSEILDIVNGTGRRISAICALRHDDLKLDYAPHGAICWPAATDKEGREWLIPISPQVRAALERTLRERAVIGGGLLFPKPDDPNRPVSRHLARDWLLKAERLAKVPKQRGTLWQAYRRKWATERKHLPDVDVAAAGGWSETSSLKLSYQQADQQTMLRVVLEAGELREAK